MKNFAGTPGTWTGLVLRMAQCLFAAGSIASMATTTTFFNYTTFWYFFFSPLQMNFQNCLCLLNCFNGFASHLEFWPCFHGCLCTIKEEGSSQSCSSQPLCSRRLVKRKLSPYKFPFNILFLEWTTWQVTATLSLAASASSAGIMVLYFGDLGGCNLREECTKYQMAVALAFLSWITIAISSLIMFWLLAAG
ncbi:hypothetical protein Pfo_026410 [Paulownia fortunei]|nr:hypothetical protein Pfo_026410 [Paulownia fortunei]